MRTLLHPATLLLALTPAVPAAPALWDKPPKWEYAELSYRNMPPRPGGVDADGTVVPATPASVSIRWITGAAEVELKGWEELANKLKMPGLKKGSLAFTRIQVLNFLGSEGWELMEQQASGVAAGGFGARGAAGGDREPVFRTSSTTGTWLLKRRVP